MQWVIVTTRGSFIDFIFFTLLFLTETVSETEKKKKIEIIEYWWIIIIQFILIKLYG